MLNNPLLNKDAYKTDHISQYPQGTQRVYSNFVARKSRVPGVDHVTFFGIANYVSRLRNEWTPFFRDKDYADSCIEEYQEIAGHVLNSEVRVDQYRKLQKLGRLPITLRSLQEGTRVPIGVPMVTIENTHDDFFWLPQAIETHFSNMMWKPITSATMAVLMREDINRALVFSGGPKVMAPYLNHDFSARGLTGEDGPILSGMGHLVGSDGTDTLAAAAWIRRLYGSLVGSSIHATEHSVMCVPGKDMELATFDRLLDLYHDKPFSVVSDTWSLWRVLDTILPKLREKIMKRTAPMVIRPDSGVPANILLGDPNASEGIVRQGVVPYLLDNFGYRTTTKRFRLLPEQLGTIYGDAMNRERCQGLSTLALEKNICPSTMVRGIGSYQYEMVTRDTFGHALKATDCVVDNEHREIFKDPETDTGEKKSFKGRVGVIWGEDGQIKGAKDGLSVTDLDGFSTEWITDGKFNHFDISFTDVRKRTGVWS